MGRSSKFSFPLPGRRAQPDRDPPRLPASDPPPPEPVSHPSKAERLLGTGIPRTGARSTRSRSSSATPSLEQKNANQVSIALSEASSDPHDSEAGPVPAIIGEDKNTLAVPPRWPQLHHRRSANALQPAAGRSRSGSVSKPVSGKESSSTLRSYYDAKRTPLAISQQTSASAAAYGGLHKPRQSGHGSSGSIGQGAAFGQDIPAPPSVDEEDDVADEHYDGLHEEHHEEHHDGHGRRHSRHREHRDRRHDDSRRKKKPAKLDLSKLFPKAPKDKSDSGLLSPAKFVSSPGPMSSTSMFFPNNRDAHKPASIRSTRTTETVKDGVADNRSQWSLPNYRDPYDNAKVNVRRPPPGIQHWFEGLSEEDEEDAEEGAIEAMIRARSSRQQSVSTTREPSPHSHSRHASRNAGATRGERAPVDLTKTSHFSMTTRASDAFYNLREQESQTSLSSNFTSKTKASKLETSNLHKDTVLSLSSSDEEEILSPSTSQLPPVRASLSGSADFGDVIIGRAQAFEIMPRPKDKRRESDYSVRSSTTAATIDVMLSTSHDSHLALPRHSSSRRSSHQHSRQPSAIPEDEVRQRTTSVDAASLTSVASPDSCSVRSARTSKSEPRSHAGHKLMAVTEEEEILLELMRRKRAAMAKHSFTEGYRTAIKLESARATPSGFREDEPRHPRTSGFLAMESPVIPERHHRHTSSKLSTTSGRRSKKPSMSQSQAAEMVLNASNTVSTETLANASQELNRMRSLRKNHKHPHISSQSLLRDSGTSETLLSRARSEQTIRQNQVPQLSPGRLSFSPLEDIFPSPPDSPSFPATGSHTDTLPSPVTPGPGIDEDGLVVKVAGSSVGSEASYGANADIEAFHLPGSHYSKPTFREKSKARESRSSHGRHRTASSGNDLDMDSGKMPSRPSTSLGGRSERDRAVRRSRSSNMLSTYAPPAPVPTLSALRTARSSVTSTSTNPSSYKPSVVSSRTSRHNSITSQATSAGKRESHLSRSTSSTAHNSVSEDILAAWGSLGGLREDFGKM